MIYTDLPVCKRLVRKDFTTHFFSDIVRQYLPRIFRHGFENLEARGRPALSLTSDEGDKRNEGLQLMMHTTVNIIDQIYIFIDTAPELLGLLSDHATVVYEPTTIRFLVQVG